MPQGPPELHEHLVTQPDQLAACCERLAAARRFGLDTEFVGEDTYHPRLCLVQVATADGLFLIDPLSAGPLDAFWQLVNDPANLVIVHAGREEVRLCHLWSGRPPGNLFDLQIAAGLIGLTYPIGHGTLVSQLLGVKLSKGETLTEWRSRPLTRAQIRYAFDDVRYLLALWQKLHERLDELGRLEWAREEFERLKDLAAPGDPAAAPANEKWRKLRGLGSLDRRRLAVVRELYHWRDEMAAKSNRPPRTIVRDDLLIEIARRNPTRDQDLHVVRGLAKRDTQAILQAVERARGLPAEQWPRPAEREQDPTQVPLLAGVVSAVLGHLCAERHLAPNLVATGQDVRLLVRSQVAGEPLPAESLLCRGWRAAHVLPELLAVLQGRLSLTVADVTAEAPFALHPAGIPPLDPSDPAS
jgi:ribonuclease D